ncbi:MAG: FmdB family transcriptional regulator [Candidatus Eremiobacteraeota bacterium]|nr:FmdB family transcriptional regulator [Candidatus Eremiobacteraeota bacterium]
MTDIRHGFKETTNESCPKCAGDLKRLFNPAGIVFKGSGFYVTDSRKSADAKAEAPNSDAPATTAPKAESSSGSSGPKSDAAA